MFFVWWWERRRGRWEPVVLTHWEEKGVGVVDVALGFRGLAGDDPSACPQEFFIRNF